MSEQKVWNSLERTKLGFSLVTPLAVLILGVVVQRTAIKEQVDREAAAEARAAGERRAALNREEVLRREGRAKEIEGRKETRQEARQARDEAFQREKALRAEAFAREKLLRLEADQRDEMRRGLDQERELTAKQLERKLGVWAEIAPTVTEIAKTSSKYVLDKTPTYEELDKLHVIVVDLRFKIEAYASYFSYQFNEAIDNFLINSSDLIKALGEYEERSKDSAEEWKKATDLYDAQQSWFQKLISITRDELALRPRASSIRLEP